MNVTRDDYRYRAEIQSAMLELVPKPITSLVHVVDDPLRQVDSGRAMLLIAIIRCALDNAVMHSHPSRVAVDIRGVGAGTAITVQDDGCGFVMERARQGSGLALMQSYTTNLGGHFGLFSVPGMGTTVSIELPGRLEQPHQWEVDMASGRITQK